MTDRVEINGLKIARELHDFAMNEVLPGTGVDAETFWHSLSQIVHTLSPRNRALLSKRDDLQAKIDAWHRANGAPSDLQAYEAFLREIGYLLPEGPDFKVTTSDVDPEISQIAGPQLVVPVMNARYALNAANARWGSLYDALYGTDAIPETAGAERGKGFNPQRGEKVIAWARKFLDESIPLKNASWADAARLSVKDGKLAVDFDGAAADLADPAQFTGYSGEADSPREVVLARNGLHVRIIIDRNHPIGSTDRAGIADVVMEAALTTIMDCEDSVAAVDAEDKVLA